MENTNELANMETPTNSGYVAEAPNENPSSLQEIPFYITYPDLSQTVSLPWTPATPNPTPYKEIEYPSPQSNMHDQASTFKPDELFCKKVLFENKENLEEDSTSQFIPETYFSMIEQNTDFAQEMISTNDSHSIITSPETILKRDLESTDSQPTNSKKHKGLDKSPKKKPLYAQDMPSDMEECRRWKNAVNTEKNRNKRESETTRLKTDLENKTLEVDNLKEIIKQQKSEINLKHLQTCEKNNENENLKESNKEQNLKIKELEMQIFNLKADLEKDKENYKIVDSTSFIVEPYKQHIETLQNYNATLHKLVYER